MNIYVLSILMILGFNVIAHACTVIYATDGQVVLAGNNEDWSDPNTKVWFYPTTGDKHGWVKFGFAGGFPQGGINDQGLFWDATGCPQIEMPFSEAYKLYYDGPLMEKVITECATVEEARMMFNTYYCQDQYQAQYLLGDARGASMLVEGDSLLLQNGGYRVAANFYHSRPELGGYPNWRYETAVNILESYDALNETVIATILSATHQEGRYPTQYSTIYDLNNRTIILFYNHNYQEYVFIELDKELAVAAHAYSLQDLFSAVQIISPLQIQISDPNTVTFQWRGKTSSRYELYYGTNPDLSDSDVIVIGNNVPDRQNRMAMISTITVLLCLGWILNKRHYKLILLIALLVMSCILVTCSDSLTEPHSNLTEFRRTINDLTANTDYYWKIIAYPEGVHDLHSETTVKHFQTAPAP